MKKLSLFIAAAAAVFLAACSTPESRIQSNPAVFATLSPADQQLIREGKVAIGFTQEMVRLALGDPDRVYTRTDANGVSESWSYTTYESESGMLLYRGFYHRHWGYSYYPYFVDYPSRRTREYFKVVFTGGRVSAIESQT